MCLLLSHYVTFDFPAFAVVVKQSCPLQKVYSAAERTTVEPIRPLLPKSQEVDEILTDEIRELMRETGGGKRDAAAWQKWVQETHTQKKGYQKLDVLLYVPCQDEACVCVRFTFLDVVEGADSSPFKDQVSFNAGAAAAAATLRTKKIGFAWQIS